jgi:hypothetical protein
MINGWPTFDPYTPALLDGTRLLAHEATLWALREQSECGCCAHCRASICADDGALCPMEDCE